MILEELKMICTGCGRFLNTTEEAYAYVNGKLYCGKCFKERFEIHEYSYKPDPIFYGEENSLFMGVEVEMDKGGCYYENVLEILKLANAEGDYCYCKKDSSLSEGIELVSHPMTLDFHKSFCWKDIFKKAVSLGYRSHQTSTCGLHIHVNRDFFGKTVEEQDDAIARIIYFVESHWYEMVKFSRRTESQIEEWCDRTGRCTTPKETLDNAKIGGSRYVAVNLTNKNTIEFRLFRGTLKYNTFIATLQFVNRICKMAIERTDNDIEELSWNDFMAEITEPELIQYLNERHLYI